MKSEVRSIDFIFVTENEKENENGNENGNSNGTCRAKRKQICKIGTKLTLQGRLRHSQLFAYIHMRHSYLVHISIHANFTVSLHESFADLWKPSFSTLTA